ncbi:MAG TPA: hypothetical protein IAC41_02570 [Candidatus Merdenecus merdavium]|nr:hypothetical protein [Candidatus Merdenecus merdavium]
MKGKKERQSHRSIYAVVVSVLIVILTFFAFMDFGMRFHLFPLVFFLGAILNGILMVYYSQKKKKIGMIIFGFIAVALVILGIVLCIQIWR